jgi:hypothetical protein
MMQNNGAMSRPHIISPRSLAQPLHKLNRRTKVKSSDEKRGFNSSKMRNTTPKSKRGSTSDEKEVLAF